MLLHCTKQAIKTVISLLQQRFKAENSFDIQKPVIYISNLRSTVSYRGIRFNGPMQKRKNGIFMLWTVRAVSYHE